LGASLEKVCGLFLVGLFWVLSHNMLLWSATECSAKMSPFWSRGFIKPLVSPLF
jgi:hypothetical protein